ncbi:hypothetical protein VOLCADRAFT_96990 [Volvox carteri f. nagariensis]|uniref:Uncharacterized protein n=1 Tax=Volvox carteri f. nagariensis TaxID=3068 RepID=D8UBL2_VOLCA|nr:uncharacterized protein VOLCADRAFT_96990 [Volvox carteri f. nagariensis]EFJ42841.1 hypothetical protein VOLCADRAFT_96990 [Volvox carteri f. nagariensis]|eukprot:XP_002956101.1 hypothetical protein VOLCADRAFT_96990 [Volvox carteri f. nagariensis]
MQLHPPTAITANAGGGVVTPRSIRYMVADPRPEPHARRRYPSSPLSKLADGLGQLLTPGAHGGGGVGAGGGDGEGSSTVTGLSAKEVVLNRLQMVLIADRCGVSPEDLLEMKAQTLTALAEYMGKDLEEDVEQLEVQVSALKPNGEKVTMTIGFAAMLADEQLRDPIQYHYEFEDDDDYFFPEEDDGRVADIAEPPSSAPKAIWGGVAAQQKQQQQLQRQHAASRGGAAAAAGAGAGAGEGGTCY